MTDQPTPRLADIALAAHRLAGLAVRTPLIGSPILDERTGGRVLLKCESLQRTGSFKFRGAYNALASLDPAVRARGVVAVSSGNHAQGVAEAARLFGVRAIIVMPADAPAIKRERTERSGARVVPYDRATEDREEVAAKILAAEGGTLVHPFDDARVIAGQGTVGLEILNDTSALGVKPDAVLVPCSGGGLIAGVGLAVRSGAPKAEIYAVEPEGFDDYRRSLAAGEIVRNERAAGSVADSLLASSPGTIGFGLNRQTLAGGLVVSDTEALGAVAFAFRELKLVVEPGGAVGLAALLTGKVAARDRVVVVLLSGGNIDEKVLNRALEAPPL